MKNKANSYVDNVDKQCVKINEIIRKINIKLHECCGDFYTIQHEYCKNNISQHMSLGFCGIIVD